MYALSNKTQCITLICRSIAGLCALVAWACFIYADQEHQSGEITAEDLGVPWIVEVAYGAEFAFTWSLIAIPLQLSSPYGVHPGLYVAFDFLSWAFVLSMTIPYYVIMYWYYRGDGYSCRRLSDDCDGKAVAITEQVGAALALLAVVLHFGLFAWACRATDKLKKSVRAGVRGPGKISSVGA